MTRMLHTHKDTIEVLLVAGGYVTATLTNIDLVIKILAGLLTCSFMIYKFYKEFKK